MKCPWAAPKPGSVPGVTEEELEQVRELMHRVGASLAIGKKTGAGMHVVGKLNRHLSEDSLVAVEFVGFKPREIEALCPDLAAQTQSRHLGLRGKVAWFFRPHPQESIAQLIARLSPSPFGRDATSRG